MGRFTRQKADDVSTKQDFVAEAELDFHNRGILSPHDVEFETDIFLREQQILGKRMVLVITGKGKMVRPVIGRFLKTHPVVMEFKTAGYYNGQDGAYEVILKL